MRGSCVELSLVTLTIEIYENDAAIPRYTDTKGEIFHGHVTLKVSDIEQILYVAGLEDDRKSLRKKMGRRTVELSIFLDAYLKKALGFREADRSGH
jgi:hypothetical protein